MDPYLIFFGFGCTGLTLMAGLGLMGEHAEHAHGPGHSHGNGHSPGHSHPLGHGQATNGHGGLHGHPNHLPGSHTAGHTPHGANGSGLAPPGHGGHGAPAPTGPVPGNAPPASSGAPHSVHEIHLGSTRAMPHAHGATNAAHGVKGALGRWGKGHAPPRVGGHGLLRSRLATAVVTWLSPRVLFTLSLGGGATGMALQPYLGEPWRGAVALLGGVGLEWLVVAPLWAFFMRFASRPARTLESAVFEEAVALTAFDAQGCGLVSVELDGREMRTLARLSPAYRGHPIRQGQRLLVEEVDASDGSCRVSPLLQ